MDSLDLRGLRKEITERMLRDVVSRELDEPVPPHNAGSGIVVGWDPRDELPDLAIGTLLPSVPRLKERAKNLCRKWCQRGLVKATPEELDAAIHGRKIVQWYRFEKQCNIPTSKNITSQDISNYAWECFQEECFNRLVGWKDEPNPFI